MRYEVTTIKEQLLSWRDSLEAAIKSDLEHLKWLEQQVVDAEDMLQLKYERLSELQDFLGLLG